MKLTITEKSDLQKLKVIVSQNAKGFVAAGNALAEIQERKLYREESLTFELFCFKQWGWKKSQVYRLIESAATVKTSPIGDKIKTESQARELAKVPPAKHAEVMKAASSKGTPTAKSIAAAAASKPEIILDQVGTPVTKAAMVFWNRREEIQTLLTQVTHIKSAVKRAQDNKDLLFAEVNFSSTLAYLDNVHGLIKRALPYAVCPTCQGKLVERCTLCGGRGVVSSILYQRVDEGSKKGAGKK
jgi:hypothetical protein